MNQTLRAQRVSVVGFGDLECFSGLVNLFRFFQAPRRGEIIGDLNIPGGGTIPLVQTQSTPPGGTPLSAVDGQFATVCGRLITRRGQVALDVRLVFPGAQPAPAPPPPDVNNQLLLLLLLLLLFQGRFGAAGQNINVTSLLGQLQSQGISL